MWGPEGRAASALPTSLLPASQPWREIPYKGFLAPSLHKGSPQAQILHILPTPTSQCPVPGSQTLAVQPCQSE